jgi:hypothetical protein
MKLALAPKGEVAEAAVTAVVVAEGDKVVAVAEADKVVVEAMAVAEADKVVAAVTAVVVAEGDKAAAAEADKDAADKNKCVALLHVNRHYLVCLYRFMQGSDVIYRDYQ